MTSPRKHSVLIVDDEEALRQAVAWDFRRKGFEVLEADNGNTAFEVLTRQPVDLVLTDVRMPVCDGVELLGRIQTIENGRPVVFFLTGFADLAAEEAFDLGAEAVFPKPFDRRQLMETVQQALVEKSRRWQAAAESASVPLREWSLTTPFPGMRGDPVRVGLGGFFAQAETEPLPQPGEIVRFRLKAATGRPALVEGTATVRWVRPNAGYDAQGILPRGFGLEFRTVNDEHRTGLLETLARLSLQSWIPKA